MNRIEEDIKSGSFSGIYLIYGDEDFLKKHYRDRLIKAVIPPDDTINLNFWQGKDIDLGELEEQIRTLPFFAARRMIVIDDSGFFKKPNEAVLKMLSSIPETTILLFVESEVDGRSKLYKTAKAKGVLQECKHLKEEELSSWALRKLTHAGKRIQHSAMNALLSRTGTDMNLLSNEIEKLISYTYERSDILLEDVLAVVSIQTEDRIFEMIDKAASGAAGEALRLYHDLLMLKEPPVRILSLLSVYLTRMLMVKELRDQGFDAAAISDKTGIKLFIVRKSISMGSNLSLNRLKNMIRFCNETDYSIKTGKITDVLGVELVIVQIGKR